MIKQFMKMGGVKTEEEFYTKYPTEQSFFEAFPQAQQYIRQQGGGAQAQDPLSQVIIAVAQQLQIDPNQLVQMLQQDPNMVSQLQQMANQDPQQAAQALMQLLQNSAAQGQAAEQAAPAQPGEMPMDPTQAMQMAYGGSKLDKFIRKSGGDIAFPQAAPMYDDSVYRTFPPNFPRLFQEGGEGEEESFSSVKEQGIPTEAYAQAQGLPEVTNYGDSSMESLKKNKSIGSIEGMTVSQIWTKVTGLPWSEAKKRGLTDGTYSSNIALKKDLLKGVDVIAKKEASKSGSKSGTASGKSAKNTAGTTPTSSSPAFTVDHPPIEIWGERTPQPAFTVDHSPVEIVGQAPPVRSIMNPRWQPNEWQQAFLNLSPQTKKDQEAERTRNLYFSKKHPFDLTGYNKSRTYLKQHQAPTDTESNETDSTPPWLYGIMGGLAGPATLGIGYGASQLAGPMLYPIDPDVYASGKGTMNDIMAMRQYRGNQPGATPLSYSETAAMMPPERIGGKQGVGGLDIEEYNKMKQVYKNISEGTDEVYNELKANFMKQNKITDPKKIPLNIEANLQQQALLAASMEHASESGAALDAAKNFRKVAKLRKFTGAPVENLVNDWINETGMSKGAKAWEIMKPGKTSLVLGATSLIGSMIGYGYGKYKQTRSKGNAAEDVLNKVGKNAELLNEAAGAIETPSSSGQPAQTEPFKTDAQGNKYYYDPQTGFYINPNDSTIFRRGGSLQNSPLGYGQFNVAFDYGGQSAAPGVYDPDNVIEENKQILKGYIDAQQGNMRRGGAFQKKKFL